MKKRLLSSLLAVCMVLSLVPNVWPVVAQAAESSGESSTSDTSTKDALGITMVDWTDEEKAAALEDPPFGTGVGTWTTLMEVSELYFSLGYDNNTRKTGFFDWNNTETTAEQIGKNITEFTGAQLTSRSETYKIVTTAPMDLMGSGKNEYVVNLALKTSTNQLCLYVTDRYNTQVGNMLTFANVAHLSELEVHQIKGAFEVVAGDFDGDGVDTVVVYIPQTDGKKETQNGWGPFIKEYSVTTEGVWTEKSKVAENVLTLLGNGGKDLGGINQITTMKNSPLVDLVAEDVDRDGYDELIVTGSMNDVTNGVTQLGTKVFIYDKKTDGSWNKSYHSPAVNGTLYGEAGEIQIEDKENRMVWGGTTVGNIMVTTSTTEVDYPEIITVGFVDGEEDHQQNINVPSSDDMGASVLRVTEVTSTDNGKNVICSYEEVLNQVVYCNGWTKDGFYESEDINSLLQIQAFSDQGLAAAESVFISGSVYRINSDNKLEEAYKYDDFGKGGKGVHDETIKNRIVAAVTAGNFDGNNEGCEQLIFVTSMKESSKNDSHSYVYCYYYDTDKGEYKGTCSNWLTDGKGSFYVSLATLDPDNDSIIAKLEDVDRDYTAPYVLAILEAAPYFAEIEDGDVGNSETIYGNESTEGSGSSNSFGFTLGTSVGYEVESTIAQSGAGFELALDQAFNWSTANTTTTTWFTEYSNDTSDNVVVVYRCPVVVYTYKDQNGKTMVVEKVGQPADAMITVDQYNAAAEKYGLEQIDSSNAKLGTPGAPASYRKNTSGLLNPVQFNGVGKNASSKDTTAGWQQYYSSGSVVQGLTIAKEQEKTFSYDMEVSLNVFAKGGGFTSSVSYGFAYAHEETSINGSAVTKSGKVSGKNVNGYDFKWKFAAWNCTLDGNTVPVIGYLVDGVEAPPSPPEALAVEDATTNSVTLCWESGTRAATQYRIYRVGDTSDTDYVLVGAVSGDETGYTLSGLKPDETYTYVLRGVAFEEDGDAVESVDSAPITVRTQSEGSNVKLALYGSNLENGVLQSSGAEASLSVQATGTQGKSLSYQWQILPYGSSRWQNVNALNSGECTVSGATSATLTLTEIDRSLGGSRLRCVAQVISTGGDVDTYYSPIVTLYLNGVTTTGTITLTGTGVTGTGSIADPYTGTADYQAQEASLYTDYVVEPLTYTDAGGTVYDIYAYRANENSPKTYVAMNDGEYYAAIATEQEQAPAPKTTVTSVGAALTLESEKYYSEGETETLYTTLPEGFDGEIVSETVGEGESAVTYEKQYAVDGTTLTGYWLNTTDEQYYTKSEGGFTLAAPQPGESADLRSVYYEEGNTLILDAAALTVTDTYTDDDGNLVSVEVEITSEYARYAVYTKGENGSYTLESTIRCVLGTKLYQGETAYADLTGLSMVYNWREVSKTKITYKDVPGTEITLKADVADKSGTAVSTQVVFTLTNTYTGSVTQLLTTSGTEVKWTAPAYGFYRIVATSAATTSTQAGTAECYYFGDTLVNNYRLVLKQDDTQVTNLTYGGSSVTPVLEERIRDTDGKFVSWDEVTSGVTYRVNGVDIDSGSYTLAAAGNYSFSAVVDGEVVATAFLPVSKKVITVTPEWQSSGIDGTVNRIPAYSAIKLVATDEQGLELSGILDGVMTVGCDLYDTNGALKTGASAGAYTVTAAYVNETAQDLFLSRYSVTTNTKSIYYFSDAITVRLAAGENGEVYARYIDPSGTEFAFTTNSQISMDYRLKFIAEPSNGWSVDDWAAMVGTTNIMGTTTYYNQYGDTLEITAAGMAYLKTLTAKEIEVIVAFTNLTHEIAYSTGDSNGTLTAQIGNNTISTGTSVAHNASVTFTATPDEGKMVEKWTVGGVDYKWPGTNDLYRETTLTLDNIKADQTVTVSFKAKETHKITTAFTIETGTADVQVTAKLTNGQAVDLENVVDGSAVTFTATGVNDGNIVVKEWKVNDEVVKGSGGLTSYTCYNVTGDLTVTVVVAAAQSYDLSWKIMAGTDEITDAKIASLTAKSRDTALTSGNKLTAYLPVDFALTISDDDYEFVKWSENVTVDETDNMKASIASLTANTEVTATIKKKPTVWVQYSVVDTNGTEEGGTNGKLIPTINGHTYGTNWDNIYVRYDQSITLTATPDDGYKVKEWTLDGSPWKDAGTKQEMTLSMADYKDKSDIDRQVTVTVEFVATSSGGGGGAAGGGGGGGGGFAPAETFTLTFDTNGGSAIDKVTKDSGATVDLAAYQPTRDGYVFAGWYSDAALTKAVTSVKLTANTTVYAKWTQEGTEPGENPFTDVKSSDYYYDAVLWAVENNITTGLTPTTFGPEESCTRAQMVTFLWRAAGEPKAENAENPFTDVKPGDYFYDAVLWAVENGITNGMDATTFGSDVTVTRDQTVTFLWRAAGEPKAENAENPFTDMKDDAYYYDAVLWAVENGITNGMDASTFGSGEDCTRGQIVTFLYRSAEQG